MRHDAPPRIGPLLIALSLGLTTSALAQDRTVPPTNIKREAPGTVQSGFGMQADLSVRPIPIGLSVTLEPSYRLKLWDSDNILLANTYVEAGSNTWISPALIWAGAYVEAVPLAILQLRATAYYMKYFGTFGFIYLPADAADPSWTLEDIAESSSQGAGVAASGWSYELKAVPRVRLFDNRFVALADLRYSRISMNVNQVYYEPLYDIILAPEDGMWHIRPMVGGIVYRNDEEKSYLLTALRWERYITQTSAVTRDTLNLLFLWGLPRSWIATGKPRAILQAGFWLNHPQERQWDPFVALQFSMTFGEK